MGSRQWSWGQIETKDCLAIFFLVLWGMFAWIPLLCLWNKYGFDFFIWLYFVGLLGFLILHIYWNK